jgi:3-deoxy-D-manno-octulosonate 8-phosphate phosphatase (KDO 8-P phosphatase)
LGTKTAAGKPRRRSTAVVAARLFVMDVDGTLTDGTFGYASDGTEWKVFHARDGAGIKFLPLVGVEAAIVSGRTSPVVARRAAELGIRTVVQGSTDKRAAVRALRERLGIEAAAVAYVGDDLGDVEAMRDAGFSAAPADAAPEARAAATYRCRHKGGHGAVREAIEALLRRDGTWKKVLAAFSIAGDSPAGAAPR